MLRNKKVLILVVLVFACCIGAFFFFKPHAVLHDLDNAELLYIRLYPDSDHEISWFKHGGAETRNQTSIIKRFNVDESFEKEILDYLSTCRERRTLERETGGHLIADVAMEIRFSTGADKMKTIYLGTYNYSFTHLNGRKSEILHPEEVKATLQKLANLTP